MYSERVHHTGVPSIMSLSVHFCFRLWICARYRVQRSTGYCHLGHGLFYSGFSWVYWVDYVTDFVVVIIASLKYRFKISQAYFPLLFYFCRWLISWSSSSISFRLDRCSPLFFVHFPPFQSKYPGGETNLVAVAPFLSLTLKYYPIETKGQNGQKIKNSLK